MTFTESPFSVDGVRIPIPSKYEWSEEDLSSSATGRTLDGMMHKDVVSIKQYYTLTWDSLSWADAAVLLNAVAGKTRVTFTYLDPRKPEQISSGTFYVGKRDSNGTNFAAATPWTETKMQFIEI